MQIYPRHRSDQRTVSFDLQWESKHLKICFVEQLIEIGKVFQDKDIVLQQDFMDGVGVMIG